MQLATVYHVNEFPLCAMWPKLEPFRAGLGPPGHQLWPQRGSVSSLPADMIYLTSATVITLQLASSLAENSGVVRIFSLGIRVTDLRVCGKFSNSWRRCQKFEFREEERNKFFRSSSSFILGTSVGSGLHPPWTRGIIRSSGHFVVGRPTLCCPMRGLHSRSFGPQRPPVLRQGIQSFNFRT